jgi:hypothetical protein
MGNDVFANGREVSCKAADGKAICAFPDVCFTPPQTPATPPGVPIPYPNTGMASDTTDGSKSVKVSGKEVMLKNKSYFKKSMGDEAGCAPKKGLITSTNRGKVYFNSWSMDVKFEGENVVRHLDMTTHNHASSLGQTPPWLYADEQAVMNDPELCSKIKNEAKEKCRDSKQTVNASGEPAGRDCDEACKAAQKCVLSPKDEDKSVCCKDDVTGHHLVEVHCFSPPGGRKKREVLPDFPDYNSETAPCVCASTPTGHGTHGTMHSIQGKMERFYAEIRKGQTLKQWGGGINEKSSWTYAEARDTGAMAHKMAFPDCNAECIRKQLDEYHKGKAKVDENAPVRTDTVRRRAEVELDTSVQQRLRAEKSNIKMWNQGAVPPGFTGPMGA